MFVKKLKNVTYWESNDAHQRNIVREEVKTEACGDYMSPQRDRHREQYIVLVIRKFS